MDNSIRKSYLAILRDAISRILSDVDKVHQLTFLIEKTSFESSEGKLDAYINYIQGSIQTLEHHKEGYIASNQSQMPQQLHHQTSQGASHSQPLNIDHQQQQIQKPNIPSQPLVDHQLQQLQQPNNLNQHSMSHHKQPNHSSQPFVSNQQQHIQQPNNPSQPSMGRQQQPCNPNQPLMAHKQKIRQAKIPSQPTFGHQQQRIQPPNLRSKPLMGPQQQQIPSHLQQSQRPNFPNQPLTVSQHQQNQHPTMPIQPVMGQHQQQISDHWQQSQRPNFPNQPLMGPQQQQIQNPNMPIQPFTGHPQQQNPNRPIQPFTGHHQQQNPSHRQQSHIPNFPSNPRMDHQQQNNNQQPSMGYQQQNNQQPSMGYQQQNNQQPSIGYQQQTQTNSKQSKTTTEKARAARKAKTKSKQQPQQQQGQVQSNPSVSLGVPASQFSQYQGHPTFNPPLPPYNTQLQNPYQQQNAFPYQHQYRFPPPQQYHFPPNSQVQQSQNPQNTQLQRPQVSQYPYQHQHPNHPHQYNPSHLEQNHFSLDSQQLQHKSSLKRQEQNQLTPQQPKRRRKAVQQNVKKDSGLPAPQPHLVPQISNQRSQPPSHTSNQNVPKNELAKNSMVSQSNNQESKQIPLNTANGGVPSIESGMKEDLNNGKLDQTQSSTSIVAQDDAKMELIKKTQSPTSSLVQGALERKLGPIKHDKKEAHNEELERAPAKEVANQEGDSTKHTEKEDNKEELEKAPSYPDWLSELVNDADAGLDYDVEADASAWLAFRAPQLEENATGNPIERLVNQIKSMEPNTFRDAVIEMASSLIEDDCKVPGHHFLEHERWYRRIAKAREESNCTNKESTQLELVQEDIITIRNKIIGISAMISEDEEEKQNAFMNINPESVTEEDTKNGIFVKLSYLALSLDKDYKREYNSQPKMQIKPLRVLIPPNYPQRSPIILERYPESSQITEEFSAMAIAKFLESASCVEEPITLPKVAEIWNKSTREVVVSYAVKRGGGTFTSKYGEWTYCDKEG